MFNFTTPIAQNVIFDRSADGGPGYLSIEGADGVGRYLADYFKLEEDTYLGEITFHGLGLLQPFSDIITGFNVYIFEHDGIDPIGEPFLKGGAHVELNNISSDNITIFEIPGKQQIISDVTVNLKTANNEEPILLKAGEYWISASPIVSGLTGEDMTWYWTENTSNTPEFTPMVINPTDKETNFWLPLKELLPIGEGSSALAWTLTSAPLRLDNLEANTFKHLVKNNQLLINSDLEINNVTIYNSLGQQVISQSINTTYANINLSNLRSGVYFSQANLKGETNTFKFVKLSWAN